MENLFVRAFGIAGLAIFLGLLVAWVFVKSAVKNGVIEAYAEIEKSKKNQNAKKEQTGIIAPHAGSEIED